MYFDLPVVTNILSFEHHSAGSYWRPMAYPVLAVVGESLS